VRESADRHITQSDGYLRVDVGNGAAEVQEIYRALAAACLEQQVTRVLVRAGSDDPVSEHALREAVTTLLLAGMPPDFKLALVADSPRIEARYRNAERDLCLANVNTKIFDDESKAARWLA
jgi:hypothetical protein